MDDQKITVQCECGKEHKFSAAHVGKTAKCPTLGKRFIVPNASSPVVFLDESYELKADQPASELDKEFIISGRRRLPPVVAIEASKTPGQRRTRKRKLVHPLVIYFAGTFVLAILSPLGGLFDEKLPQGLFMLSFIPLFVAIGMWIGDLMTKTIEGMGEGAGCMLIIFFGPAHVLIQLFGVLCSVFYRLYFALFCAMASLLGFGPKIAEPWFDGKTLFSSDDEHIRSGKRTLPTQSGDRYLQSLVDDDEQ